MDADLCSREKLIEQVQENNKYSLKTDGAILLKNIVNNIVNDVLEDIISNEIDCRERLYSRINLEVEDSWNDFNVGLLIIRDWVVQIDELNISEDAVDTYELTRMTINEIIKHEVLDVLRNKILDIFGNANYDLILNTFSTCEECDKPFPTALDDYVSQSRTNTRKIVCFNCKSLYYTYCYNCLTFIKETTIYGSNCPVCGGEL